jgi:hypothetical protein
MPRPSHHLSFHQSDNIYWIVKIIKLLTESKLRSFSKMFSWANPGEQFKKRRKHKHYNASLTALRVTVNKKRALQKEASISKTYSHMQTHKTTLRYCSSDFRSCSMRM